MESLIITITSSLILLYPSNLPTLAISVILFYLFIVTKQVSSRHHVHYSGNKQSYSLEVTSIKTNSVYPVTEKQESVNNSYNFVSADCYYTQTASMVTLF